MKDTKERSVTITKSELFNLYSLAVPLVIKIKEKIQELHEAELAEIPTVPADALKGIRHDHTICRCNGTCRTTHRHTATTAEQAIDDAAERKLDELDKKATNVGKTGKKSVKVAEKKPFPKSLKEVAQLTGATYKQVQKYAYTHGIGVAGKTLDGHQCRILTVADVKALIRHFRGGK